MANAHVCGPGSEKRGGGARSALCSMEGYLGARAEGSSIRHGVQLHFLGAETSRGVMRGRSGQSRFRCRALVISFYISTE